MFDLVPIVKKLVRSFPCQQFAGCKIIFFDAGTYIVSSTITIPAGTKVVGEAWTTIAGKGPAFSSQLRPTPVIQVGKFGSVGTMEITDMLFTTVGSGMFHLIDVAVVIAYQRLPLKLRVLSSSSGTLSKARKALLACGILIFGAKDLCIAR